jgi:hypothetical protein
MSTPSRTTGERTRMTRVETTLLELVVAVSEVAASDAETVAVIRQMMASGRVRLRGHFTETDFAPYAQPVNAEQLHVSSTRFVTQ